MSRFTQQGQLFPFRSTQTAVAPNRAGIPFSEHRAGDVQLGKLAFRAHASSALFVAQRGNRVEPGSAKGGQESEEDAGDGAGTERGDDRESRDRRLDW
jgi:hypothetical protein